MSKEPSARYHHPNFSRARVAGTQWLLIGGVVVGPLYLLVGLIQAFTRPGFDLSRHALSLLSNGPLGWIHITNLILCGLLVIGAAIGAKRSMHPGLGRNWGTALIGVYGLSLVGAGVFIADPALGFPVGTPTEPTVVTWHGVMHFICGGVGFLALVVACFVFARRFAALRQEGWRTFSLLTGVVFLAGFVGIASGSGSGWSILGFWVALVIAWSWLSALSARLAGGTKL